MADNPTSTDQAPTPSVGQPICPLCTARMADPEPGTDCCGAYELRCEACGAWMQCLRFARVTFRTSGATPSVPPRVFLGLDPEDNTG